MGHIEKPFDLHEYLKLVKTKLLNWMFILSLGHLIISASEQVWPG